MEIWIVKSSGELFHLAEGGQLNIRWARASSEKCAHAVVLLEAGRSYHLVVLRATVDDGQHACRHRLVHSVVLRTIRFHGWSGCRRCCCCHFWWNEKSVSGFDIWLETLFHVLPNKKAKHQTKIYVFSSSKNTKAEYMIQCSNTVILNTWGLMQMKQTTKINMEHRRTSTTKKIGECARVNNECNPRC